jgi:ABC-type sugar transport system substrate-binding protein
MDAIATMCDTSALGALAALENAGLAGKIKLGGMDCMGEILAAIEAGTVDNSVWQDGVGQGYHAVRLAIDVANGKEVEDYDIPYEICTKENLDIYLAKHAEREELSKKYF